jgi:putative nucleotidyltransferase with HDIG domain
LIEQKDRAPTCAPPMIEADALVKAAHGLDPLPATVARLASLVGRPDWSLNDAAHLVEFDPALTGRLLRLANSAAMAGLSPVNTARDAIMRVGIGPALAFAAASGLRKQLRRALPEYGLTDGQLWRHSVASALAVQPIARRAKTEVPPECFTAALLHDIGKIVLARFLSPDELRWLADARNMGGMSSLQAEIEVLGVHHGALGGEIAAHWKLPERLVNGVVFHHSPDEGGDVVCDVVYLANVAAKRIGEGVVRAPDEVVASEATLTRLGMTATTWEDLILTLPAAFEATLAQYTKD